jgi:putative Mg2+ transporter-C (MgtC) family protein
MPTWAEIVRNLRLEELYGLAVSILLGGIVGMERELRGKAAGLRTNILICMGATLFTQLSMGFAGAAFPKGQLAAGIVTGVGFLGAGTIMQGKGSITGLNSAATIWLVAAIGTAVGAGEVYLAGGATLIVVAVLRTMGWVESYIRLHSVVSKLTIHVEPDPHRVEEIQEVVRRAGVDIEDLQSEPRGSKIVVSIKMRGPKFAQDQAKLSLLRTSGAYGLSVEE